MSSVKLSRVFLVRSVDSLSLGPRRPFCSVQRVLLIKDKKNGHFPILETLFSSLSLDFSIFPVRLG